MDTTENHLFAASNAHSVDFDRVCQSSNVVTAFDTANLAVLFDNREQRLAAAMPFVKSGLERNQRCLYLASESSSDELRSALARFGVDHESIPDEQFVVETLTEKGRKSSLDCDGILDFVFEMVEESLNRGFDGLLITAEMSWIHTSNRSIRELLKAISRFNDSAADLPCVALAQYDMTKFDASDLIDIVHAYSDIVYRGKLRPNSYYTGPEPLLKAEKPEAKFERMLQTLTDLSAAYDETHRRQQRLDVLSRVMRHNIRNDLTLILGQSTTLKESLETEELADRADQIRTTAQNLLTIADSVNQLQTSLNHESDPIYPIPLSRTVSRVVEDVRRENPESSISMRVGPDLWVRANEDLEFAVRTLLQTVVEYSDSITLTAESPRSDSDPSISLELKAGGNQFPQAEFSAIVEGEETPLNHGDGVGLWIVHWIVDQSGGNLSIQSSQDETLFTISLPTVFDADSTDTDTP
ncbi:MEDS domain-containing protein [Halostagnicola kamekurae]|uniref:histidine kinase n=1 Tax=Halostagnicola kamekurae TaxID=619731 RepID=A0A1I6U9M9_9EURY|nr:MEDS domain-containing protein [Halostagnicola kamekurae]SFS98229.1 Signal transduction histidine kinase [Halostagnicola kamekurae]